MKRDKIKKVRLNQAEEDRLDERLDKAGIKDFSKWFRSLIYMDIDEFIELVDKCRAAGYTMEDHKRIVKDVKEEAKVKYAKTEESTKKVPAKEMKKKWEEAKPKMFKGTPGEVIDPGKVKCKECKMFTKPDNPCSFCGSEKHMWDKS